MAFMFFERKTLSLSVLGALSFFSVSAVQAKTITNSESAVTSVEVTQSSLQPATATACVALQSNVERLACYDAFFKTTEQTTTDANETAMTAQSARQENKSQAAQQSTVVVAKVDQAAHSSSTESEPEQSLTGKINQTFTSLFAADTGNFDPNVSILDRRWELSPDSKLGTWNLRTYKPIYLLPIFWTSKINNFPTSPNPSNVVHDDQNLKSTESKFQISLKTKAWENIFGNNGDLWLGYTQSSRWQVYNASESRPFRETNYEPEASLMFRTNYRVFGLDGRLLGLSLNHQSNGRSDPLSRSWNRVILNVGFERDNFALMLRPWYRIKEDAQEDNNPDIEDYIGRGDLTAYYRYNNQDFSLMLRHSLKGGDRSHGAAQFDWTFPIYGKLRGYFQLFDGYGESLIDYNHRATYVGLGVSLSGW